MAVGLVKLGEGISNLQPPPDHWTRNRIARYRDEAQEIAAALGVASPCLLDRLQFKIEAHGVCIRGDG